MLILSEIQELLKDIDTLKKNLNELIEKKNFNLQDSEIIKASQELNIAISKYNDLIVKKL
ncbi:MAG: aspartyl-phosphate phosphatase Spo0E family protein [Bacillota bacterium]|nr:aspartyl-phosphate phosphatase Spo0E family protein [Bacillota bacterium]